MIRPARGYVLISPDEAEEKTASGFYVPDSAKEKPQKGTIILRGQQELKEQELFLQYGTSFDREFAEGDKVFFKRWGGDEITDTDGKEYKLIKFDDVLAVIE